jgi:DNA-binding MarR family transcriptional regulator
VVLFNHAVAERLGLGPTDHKCLDLLLERGPMTSSELAALTGLTAGAVTGVTARLERAGFLQRTPDPQDRRKHTLSAAPDRVEEIGDVFAAMHDDLAKNLAAFDAHELTAIAQFLDQSSDCLLRHAALLRAQVLASTVTARSAAPSTSTFTAAARHGATR